MSERFTVRWFATRGFIRNSVSVPGYAVFCDGQRITLTFPSRDEAERHRELPNSMSAGGGDEI